VKLILVLTQTSGTYQAYLQRQPGFLQAAFDHADTNGYALGLKVVRGGYIVKEKLEGEKKGLPDNGAVWAR
jgi:proline dehydrogenase